MGFLFNVKVRHALFHIVQNLYLQNKRTLTTVHLAHKVFGGDGQGDGHAVFIHGLLGWKRNWESMARRMAPELKKVVVTVDLRNHGDSPHQDSHTYPELASDLRLLLDRMKIGPAYIIGHSMGGRTAMVFALTEPSKVEKLVVVDVSPVSTPGALKDFFPKLLHTMKSVKFDPKDSIPQARLVAKDVLQKSHLVDDINSLNFVLMNVGRRHDNQIGWKCNLDVLMKNFENIVSFPTNMAGRQYNGPTLFLCGEQSDYVPKSDLQGIQGYFPNVELVYVPNAGHTVHLDQPDRFFEIVAEFLKRKK